MSNAFAASGAGPHPFFPSPEASGEGMTSHAFRHHCMGKLDPEFMELYGWMFQTPFGITACERSLFRLG